MGLPDLTEHYHISPQEALFVATYVDNWDELQALEESGLKPYRKKTLKELRIIAQELIKKPAISAAIQQAVQYRIERTLTSKDKIIAHLARIASADPAEAYDEDGNLKPVKDMPYHFRCCISKIKSKALYKYNKKTKQYYFKGYTQEFELESHTNALKELARILMPTPSIQVNNQINQQNITHIDLPDMDKETIDNVLQMLSGEKPDEEVLELERIEEAHMDVEN